MIEKESRIRGYSDEISQRLVSTSGGRPISQPRGDEFSLVIVMTDITNFTEII